MDVVESIIPMATKKDMAFARKVKKLRTKILKLSQSEFARGMGDTTHIRTVQDWEYGNAIPSGATVIALEHLADCKKFQREFTLKAKDK